jgi:hypothetical protein
MEKNQLAGLIFFTGQEPGPDCKPNKRGYSFNFLQVRKLQYVTSSSTFSMHNIYPVAHP